jgi:hypothetical protein
VNGLGFGKAVDHLGKGVVFAVADTALDGLFPNPVKRLSYLIETYWLPQSL